MSGLGGRSGAKPGGAQGVTRLPLFMLSDIEHQRLALVL